MSKTEEYIRKMAEMQKKKVVDANGIEMKPGVKFVDPFDRAVVHKVVRVIPGHDSVVTDNGEEWTGIRKTKLKIANSALNAKFKVGDVVTDSYGLRLFEVTGIRSGGVYDVVDYENGTATYTMPEAKMRKASASLVKSYNNSIASTNAVVRNALAWRARNAILFGVGNKVMHHDSKMRGTIIGKYNDHLWNVKWDAGFTEPASPDDLVFISMH